MCFLEFLKFDQLKIHIVNYTIYVWNQCKIKHKKLGFENTEMCNKLHEN